MKSLIIHVAEVLLHNWMETVKEPNLSKNKHDCIVMIHSSELMLKV